MYRAPVDDMSFLIDEVLQAETVLGSLPDFAELNDLIETVELHVLWTGLKCFLQFHLILRLELAVGALLVHLTIPALR